MRRSKLAGAIKAADKRAREWCARYLSFEPPRTSIVVVPAASAGDHMAAVACSISPDRRYVSRMLAKAKKEAIDDYRRHFRSLEQVAALSKFESEAPFDGNGLDFEYEKSPKCPKNTIFIKDDLEERDIYSSMIHELYHIWQQENGIFRKHYLCAEGPAYYVSERCACQKSTRRIFGMLLCNGGKTASSVFFTAGSFRMAASVLDNYPIEARCKVLGGEEFYEKISMSMYALYYEHRLLEMLGRKSCLSWIEGMLRDRS